MTIVVALFMIMAAALVIGYPLWKSKPTTQTTQVEPNIDLLTQKEATYAALKELDFDFALGNLTREDHTELEEKYKDKAVNILKQIDARQNRARVTSTEKELESEIFRLRRPVTPPSLVRQELEDKILKLRQARALPNAPVKKACPKCNSSVPDEAKFCPHCGSSLKPMSCARCSAVYNAGERFCSQCGANLTEEKSQ